MYLNKQHLQADTAYLYIGERISRSLADVDTTGIKLIYDRALYILNKEHSEFDEYISICKSNSGINGARLAMAHYILGQAIGRKAAELIPSSDSAVLVLECGGRFFGDGFYTEFGGTFYSYNSKIDELPEIPQENIIIVDSIINSGRSILGVIGKLKVVNPDAEIIIVVNVIQRKTLEVLHDHKIFTVRV